MQLPSQELIHLIQGSAGETAEFGVGLLAMTVVTFLVLFVILSKFAIKPTLQALTNREKQIKDAIEVSKNERKEAERMVAEQKVALEQARREASEMMRKNQSDMERFREEIMGKARTEADELKVDAQRVIQSERDKAVAELKKEAVGLALSISEKLVSERMDDAKHKQMAEQFMADLNKQTPRA